MQNDQISFFRPPVTNTFPEALPLTLRETWERIRGNDYKKETDYLREIRSAGGDFSGEKRRLLHSVTFGGVFDYRSLNKETLSSLGKTGLLSPSGYFIIDIDNIQEAGLVLPDLKKSLLEDSSLGVRLLFVSPSGNGIKLVVSSLWEIDSPETYKSGFFSLMGYLHEKHKVPYIVKSGDKWEDVLDMTSDITRSCFLCHDPEAVLLEEGEYNSDENLYFEDDIKTEISLLKGERPQSKTRRIEEKYFSGDWGSFMESRLIPAIFGKVDELFPEMDFFFSGNAWKSPYKLDGSPAKNKRRDKSVITAGHKERVLEQGGGTIGIVDFYAERRGLSFPEARKELSRLCGLEEEELELRRNHAEGQNKDQERTKTMKDKETPKDGEKVSENGDFAPLMRLPQKGELWGDLKREPEGFKTPYFFGVGDERERLVIPSEGVTLICGLSSHFKSTLLRNIALQMTEDEGEGDVLFFSLEESTRKTRLRLLCAYTNTFFKKVKEYAKTGELYVISIHKTNQDEFIRNSEKFESFLTSGKLRILTGPEESSKIVSFLEYYGQQRRIKAVFIDFIQRLKSGRRVSSRLDDLRLVAEDLQNFTKREQIPVVVAAQLNRATSSPSRMGANNIAESADLTRYGETILCLWASHKKEDVTDERFPDSQEDKRLQELGFTLGRGGSIYAKLTKNKEGESGLEAVLKVEGKSGRIFDNETKEETSIKTLWGK